MTIVVTIKNKRDFKVTQSFLPFFIPKAVSRRLKANKQKALVADYSLTSTSPHSPRFRAYAYPTWQPVTNTVPGWVVRHPCFTLSLSTLLSVSCQSCLLSCSPLWPHLSQMSGAAYPVNLFVWVCVGACVCVCLHYREGSSHCPPPPRDDHLKTHPDHQGHTQETKAELTGQAVCISQGH